MRGFTIYHIYSQFYCGERGQKKKKKIKKVGKTHGPLGFIAGFIGCGVECENLNVANEVLT